MVVTIHSILTNKVWFLFARAHDNVYIVLLVVCWLALIYLTCWIVRFHQGRNNQALFQILGGYSTQKYLVSFIWSIMISNLYCVSVTVLQNEL